MKISNYLNRTMHVELFPIYNTSNHNYYSNLPFPHLLVGPASSSLIHRMDSQSLYSLPFLCVFFFCCFPYTTSMISFSFPEFLPNDNDVIVSGTATKAQVDEHPSIRLTDNVDNNQGLAIGRAYYYKPIPLWDPVANITINFTTTFEFILRTRYEDLSDKGGGIAFFITSEDSVDAPTDSMGGWMGLFNSTTEGKSKLVAVEFDTWPDQIGLMVVVTMLVLM